MMLRSLFLIFMWFWVTVILTAIATRVLLWQVGPSTTPTRWHVAWGLALLSSGIICFVLTRFLTRPVLHLREAARRLAEGELHARAAGAERCDEIGDLIRDVNVMAAQIENLVTSQRQLISDISFELRSPLARLNAALGLARQRMGQSELFDRGPGVPPDELANIFRPFYRIEGARDRRSGGVGLGLAIADRVTGRHGGSIQAINRPDGGLQVELKLPAVPSEVLASSGRG